MATGYLILYWVFDGGLLLGASYLALVQMLGITLAILSVPLITWLCNKYQKHNALRVTVFMLAINACLSWVCYNPDHPYYMFLLPFFGSIGISSMYTVMGTLMADVTDADELRNGTRREGMFGAVNAMMMKATAPIGAVMASIVIILSGFDIDMGTHQEPDVFTNMRLLLVFLPLFFLSIVLILLHKYPLSRARMVEIKAELKHRHEARAREEAEAGAEENV
jgi:GPH family glycoside/pentoside/hexuronide:cation symporter